MISENIIISWTFSKSIESKTQNATNVKHKYGIKFLTLIPLFGK